MAEKLSQEQKDNLLREFQTYKQAQAREVCRTAALSLLCNRKEELAHLLKQEGCNDRIYRMGGYLDGFTDALNFEEEFFDKLKFRDKIEPTGY